MFICMKCGKLQSVRVKSNLVPIEVRTKTYSTWNEKDKRDKASTGWEIVTEILVCPACYREAEDEKEKNLQVFPNMYVG
jgi:hypothetical protein